MTKEQKSHDWVDEYSRILANYKHVPTPLTESDEIEWLKKECDMLKRQLSIRQHTEEFLTDSYKSHIIMLEEIKDVFITRTKALENAIRSRPDMGRWACVSWPDCPVECDCLKDWRFNEEKFST